MFVGKDLTNALIVLRMIPYFQISPARRRKEVGEMATPLWFYKKDDITNDEIAYENLRLSSAEKNYTTITGERIFRIEYRDGARNIQVGNIYVHHDDEKLSDDPEDPGVSLVVAILHDEVRSDIYWICTTIGEHVVQMDDTVRVTLADGKKAAP